MTSPELMQMFSFLANNGYQAGIENINRTGQSIKESASRNADRHLDMMAMKNQIDAENRAREAERMNRAILSIGDNIGGALNLRGERKWKQEQIDAERAFDKEQADLNRQADMAKAADTQKYRDSMLALERQQLAQQAAQAEARMTLERELASMKASGEGISPLAGPVAQAFDMFDTAINAAGDDADKKREAANRLYSVVGPVMGELPGDDQQGLALRLQMAGTTMEEMANGPPEPEPFDWSNSLLPRLGSLMSPPKAQVAPDNYADQYMMSYNPEVLTFTDESGRTLGGLQPNPWVQWLGDKLGVDMRGNPPLIEVPPETMAPQPAQPLLSIPTVEELNEMERRRRAAGQ
jgi:hypothetical protein